MFPILGKFVSRHWIVCLLGWVVAIAAIEFWSPPLDDVVQDGEFAFMPDSMPSRQGEKLFQEAFSKELLGSQAVIVVRRTTRTEGLQQEDRDFIENVLKPRLEALAVELDVPAARVNPAPGAEKISTVVAAEQSATGDNLAAVESDDLLEEPAATEERETNSPISRVRTFSDKSIGHLLDSKDKQATLVMVQLKYDFLDKRNRPAIEGIEKMFGPEGTLQQEALIPPGLDIRLSGSATVGRDMSVAAEESAKATERLTVVLVIVLLIIIYRAPFLAIIPLLTVAMSVHVALSVLALLADHQFIGLFNGIKTYVTVVMYGAGVDYCVFLIARYKEELDRGASYQEAIEESISKIGGALAASAGTVIVGIGMMYFAEFGKFQQAGVAMSLSLVFVLLASLTFTPAMLLMVGRWVFWPKTSHAKISDAGWISPTNLAARMMESARIERLWEYVGKVLVARPLTVFLVTICLMMPFAIAAVGFYGHLSYGLLSELPKDETSVLGAKAVQDHFPAGATGPVTVLVENAHVDFSTDAGKKFIEEIAARLESQKDELEIADIRSYAQPLGLHGEESGKQLGTGSVLRRGVEQKRVKDYYIADRGELQNHVTRIDVEFKHDPFSRHSIGELDHFQAALEKIYPEAAHVAFAESPETASNDVQFAGGSENGTDMDESELAAAGVVTADNSESLDLLDEAPAPSTDTVLKESKLYYIGSTPSIRDLKAVTNRDQVRIDLLVLGGVFLVLVALLWKLAIPAYLMVTVFFSYLVTLGVTFLVFWALDPAGFAGLDWKVPMFLFTILIAVGEDYNIYLITRIEEEQAKYGPIEGITHALGKTGGIISSCGVIMAGTFAALMAGSLVGMQQLGFALAFGVILDTFVVRPILVPAYLILLNTGRFGAFGRLLGAPEPQPAVAATVNEPRVRV